MPINSKRIQYWTPFVWLAVSVMILTATNAKEHPSAGDATKPNIPAYVNTPEFQDFLSRVNNHTKSKNHTTSPHSNQHSNSTGRELRGVDQPWLGPDDWIASGSFRCDQLDWWSSCLYWDEWSFMQNVKNPFKWKCGMCQLVYGYGRWRGWWPSDPYSFKLADALPYYGDSYIKKFAQLTFLFKPHCCMVGDNSPIEWCNVLNYWRPWVRSTDSNIPYCRQSHCWFKPGKECLARIPRWNNMAQFQRDMVWDWRLKNHLQSLVPPIDNIVTRCFDAWKIQQLQSGCPVSDCKKKKRVDESSPLHKLLTRLRKDLKREEKRGWCTGMACSSCMDPGSGGSCNGNDPWGNTVCCSCTLEYSYSYVDW